MYIRMYYIVSDVCSFAPAFLLTCIHLLSVNPYMYVCMYVCKYEHAST